jgi:hypothetical protein
LKSTYLLSLDLACHHFHAFDDIVDVLRYKLPELEVKRADFLLTYRHPQRNLVSGEQAERMLKLVLHLDTNQ